MQLNSIKKALIAAGAMALSHAAFANPASFDFFSYSGESTTQAKAGEMINPILPGFYPDPAITRVGDDYYLVNSSFAFFPGLPIFHSKDLTHWQQIGNAFDRYEQFSLNKVTSSRGIFAPDITYHDGTYYIVSTCVECGGTFFNNFVMTAKNPAGPWSKPVSLDISGIDPSLFWDDDGKAYLVHNDDPKDKAQYDGHRAIWAQEFDAKNLKLIGERTQIVNGGDDLSKKPFWIEGPHLLKKDGMYYLIAAQGGTESNHSEVVFRSKSVTGPFVPYQHNPILTQRDLPASRANAVANTGHADLIQTQDGEWWSVFLGVRPYDAAGNFNIGRETFMHPVTWKDGWPVILDAGKAVPLTLKQPTISKQTTSDPASFSYVEAFDKDKLDFKWVSLRNTAQPFYRVSNGNLILESQGQLGDVNAVPAFVGVRQQHNQAEITTSVTFAAKKDGDQAGLAAIQSDESYVFYGIERIKGKNELVVSVRNKTKQDQVVKAIPLDVSDKVEISIKIDNGAFAFHYKIKEKQATLLDHFDATLLSTTQAGGFVGTIIGVYTYSAK